MSTVLRASALCLVAAVPLRAQSVADFVPAKAANCAIATPPPSSGIAATPGGFLMVHPRNDAIDDGYTGCKVLWIVDVDQPMRVATLYFEAGLLSRALSHDVRDPNGAIEVVCDYRANRSLLPNAGRRAGNDACRAPPSDGLYLLRLATWPRQCLTEQKAAVCKEDPR